MTKRKITKYVAWAFLSLCLIALLTLLAAGTNLGLRTGVYFANQVNGVSIEGVKGSVYSQIYIKRILINIDQGINIDAADAEIDISLSCIVEPKACLNYFRVNKLALILPKAKEEVPAAPSNDYITSPLAIDIKKLLVNQFTLSQQVAGRGLEPASVVKLIGINKLAIEQVYVFDRVSIKQVLVDDILLFAQQSGQSQPAPSGPEFSLNQLQNMLQRAPSIQLPEVFIPVNVVLAKAAVKRLCWQVHTQAKVDNCIAITSASLSVQQQSIDVKISVEGEVFFAANGIAAKNAQLQAQLNIQNNWRHTIVAKLLQGPNIHQQAELVLSLTGNADNTVINSMLLQAGERSHVLEATLAGQWEAPKLPIAMTAQIESLLPLKQFLITPFAIDIMQTSISIDGDWEQYTLNIGTQLVSDLSSASGLSSLQLSAQVSPAKQALTILAFETQGALGTISLAGGTQLQPVEADDNRLGVYSDLKIRLDKVNLGLVNADLNSNIDGEFSLLHVFTEQWMRGELICSDINGSFAGFAMSAQCDVSVSKSGEVNIKRLSLKQAGSSFRASGKFILPHTQYLRYSIADLMQTKGQLSFNADIPDASQLATKLSGALKLEGSMSGSVSEPKIRLHANAAELSFDNIGVEQASVNVSLDAKNNFALELDAKIEDLNLNNFNISAFYISASGDKDEHSITLDVQSKDLSISSALVGELSLQNEVTRWRGRWLEGAIELPFAQLKLDDEIAIVANFSEQSYRATEHCWVGNAAKDSICLSELSFAEDIAKGAIDIVYDIASIPRHYVPELVLPNTRMPLKGKLEANYSSAEGLQLTSFNNIIGAEIETSRHVLALTAMVANVTLKDEVLSTAVYAGSERTGTFGLQSQLSLMPQQREHIGRVKIDNFDLNLLQRFIPSTQTIVGMVNADVSFDGQLTEPSLSGELKVSDGELILDAYSYPLTDFHHSMTFAGQVASMEGGFKLGKGNANYSANLDLSLPLSIEGTLSGENMQFAFSNSKAQISPDLRFMVSATDLMLKGNIGIPSAEIKVEELPENARTPSPDTIIIGQKIPEPTIPLAMDIDLTIQIDKLQKGFVTVDALDLEATLSGDLSLSVEQKRSQTDNTFQPLRTTLNGQVNVIDGSYEAYGQMLVVRSGKIFFNGEPSLPQFDIRAIRNPLNTEGDVVAGLHITGNPVVPRVELFSTPAMTQAKQLSYLLQGRDLTSRDPNAGSGTDTALINALVSFGVGRSENRLGQIGSALGFDSLNLQTAGAGDSSQVQITGRIAEDIQITYGIGVFDQASEVILKYQIMPQLFIEAKSGVESAVDLFYQISRGEFE